jgi:hypothetical protein
MSDDPALRQREWIENGFVWLDQNWPADRLWPQIRPSFLEYLGVTDGDLVDSPDCLALAVIVDHVDRLTDPDEQRRVLLTEEDRYNLREAAIAEWEQLAYSAPAAVAHDAQDVGFQEPPAQAWAGSPGAWEPSSYVPEPAPASPEQPSAPAADPEGTQYFEGYGLMRVDPATHQWVPVEAAAPAASPPDAAPDVETAFAVTGAALDQAVPVSGSQAPAEPAPAQQAAAQQAPAEPAAAEPAAAEPAAAETPIRAEVREELDTVVKEEIAPLLPAALAGIEGSDLLTEDDIQKAVAEALQRIGSN